LRIANVGQTLKKRKDDQMTFDDIRNLIDDKRIGIDQRTKLALERIVQAESDWITEVKNLDDFIGIIENEVFGESSKVNVSKRLKQFEADIVGNSWEAESFTSVMEVFEYDQSKTLKEIFEEIINGLKNKTFANSTYEQ
jgi:hypothetical protein